MYKIRDAGAKGLGVFASKFIPRGTRILAESPLFSVKSERDVYAATEKLHDADRNWLTHLSIGTHKRPSMIDWTSASWNLVRNGIFPTWKTIEEHDTLLAVFRNNNFDIGNSTQAIFRNICRINHSCVPNSQGNFNTAIGCFTVHAVRPIDNEEEITISYLEEHGATRDSRQTRLFHGYGFTCNCPICDSSTTVAQKSEERRRQFRQRLREHAERIPLEDKRDDQSEFEMLQGLIQLFEEEGLAGRELSTM